MTAEKNVGIIGSSNSAWALSCYLTGMGHKVDMLVRGEQKAAQIPKTINAEDKIEGAFTLNSVKYDTKDFMESVSTIFIATVTTAYPDVIKRLLPFVSESHNIILFSSKLGGVCEVSTLIKRAGKRNIPVIETDAIFACRIKNENTIHIKGFKKWNLYSCDSYTNTIRHGHIIKKFFPFLQPADNFLQRGLSDFGAMSHPLIMMINMNTVDRGDKFLFYYEGFTQKTFSLLEAVEKERNLIAKAYGTSLISLREMLDKYYCCLKESLYDTLLNVPNYKSSISPDTLENRYIFEDVSNTLVPAHYMAELAGIKIPVLDSIISLSSVVLNNDFLTNGRTLEKLGFRGMSKEQIIDRMAG